MICLYDRTNTDFEENGNVVLCPLECSHTQVAAGKYDLTLRHPIDPWGKWQHIIPEAVIRAPVPAETIESAYSGLEVDQYLTTAKADLRSGPNEPQTITYTSWSISAEYAVGAKVSWQNRNWQCNYYDETSPYAHIAPPSCPWWAEIARTIPGDPVLVTLKNGTKLYYVSGPEDGWYKMSTTYGLEGYIKASQVEFDKHLTPAETQPHTITTQLFRIRTVNIDSKKMEITATAEHVSYDMNGILLNDVDIKKQKAAYAIAMIENAMMINYKGTIATNLTRNSDGTYTGKISGKTAIYALLDPDKGMVANFEAMYRRDNWDVFIMRKTNKDRGFRLRYGKNMIGVSWNIKSDSLITRVVPVAKAEDGSDLYLSSPKWINSDDIGNYPVIRMERLKVSGQVGKDDGTETDTKWTEAALLEEMATKATEEFSKKKKDQIIHDVTIDFEMQGDTEEYKALKDLQQVLMYDQVVAINDVIGLSVVMEVCQIEYDCIREKVKALKLTNVNAYNDRTVSGFNMFVNSITSDKLTDEAAEEIVGDTRADAVEESNIYTDARIAAVRTWVNNNFQPRS